MKKKSLQSNMEYTKAKIVDHFYTIRYSHYFTYEFRIGDSLYQGSGRYYPDTDTLCVNDTILIIYDKSNPSNNKPLRDN